MEDSDSDANANPNLQTNNFCIMIRHDLYIHM